MAAETQMPVIIHSRDAAKDTLDIMNEHCDWQNGGVIHCFSYSPEIAKIYLDKGFIWELVAWSPLRIVRN